MFRIPCLLILLTVAGYTTLAQNNKPWRMAGTKKANPVKPVAHFTWSAPAKACALLADIPGMQTRGYRNVPSQPKDYFCASSYKSVGNGAPAENNLAYYVIGDQNNARELKLVLNITTAQDAQIGRTVLAVTSNLLTKRALGNALSDEVVQALLAGEEGRWDAGDNEIAVMREEWPSGRGYELKFIIR